MPARKGADDIHISLPSQLHSALVTLASQPEYEGSKSRVIESALHMFIDQAVNMTAIDTFHQRLSAEMAGVRTIFQEALDSIKALAEEVALLRQTVTASEARQVAAGREQERRWADLVGAYDALRATPTVKAGGLFSGMRR
jgi:hypothetical protein